MGGNVQAIKERLDIAEVLGGYLKLEKAGSNYKAKCPFHNEKTASFFISTARQGYYCFGCGAKGDIFTFVEEMEGLDFRGALKTLADRAGVELKNEKRESRGELDSLYNALELAKKFYADNLSKDKEALEYLSGRGVNEESIKSWSLGRARDSWRDLKSHLTSLGLGEEVLLRSGLAKKSEDHKEKESYDTFRDRIMFPLFDPRGEVIAFSGRALSPETNPKYLNSPDTPLFTKSEVLYGLDKARDEIRKKNYAILVEGQLDLVLSHQAGVKNTVASSGTAFTQTHLERLKKISPRILLAFDGDEAGVKAAERSAILALSLGMEVKIADLPEGRDPADLVKEDPELWKNSLKNAKNAIEFFLERCLKQESDPRKILKLVESKILPLIALVPSSMERSHYVSLIAQKTGVREDLIVEDLRRVKLPKLETADTSDSEDQAETARRSRQEELDEVRLWLKENPGDKDLLKQEAELMKHLRVDELDREIAELRIKLSLGDEGVVNDIARLSKERDEERRKVL